ncbi:helix-turn-helix domain-containing protein [Lentzea sp. NPDC004782]|uniref:PucR family transcriptional regulator n=1 Tax=Lentzea sp. NPDC004782 TaxID=3154458 RepID=UPI0033A9EFA3
MTRVWEAHTVTQHLAALDLDDAGHPADVRSVLALALTAHSEAIATGTPPEHRLARLRELGARRAAARGPLDPLLDALHTTTDNVVEAVASAQQVLGDTEHLIDRIRATGSAFVRALLTGFQEAYPSGKGHPAPSDRQLLASGLLWHNDIPCRLRGRVAKSYAVVAVHRENTAPGDLTTMLDNAFAACGVTEVLPLVTENEGYVLAPARDERQAAGLCRQVHQALGGETWLAVSWCPSHEVSFAGEEAQAVLTLVRDGQRETGVYQLGDVLVEYAVLQDPSAVNHLASLIAPVLRQETLHTTLKAFIAANGNRSKAADALKIHRSTLDYRLSRIEQLTGCQPTNDRGVQLLATAMATCAAPQENAGA